MRRVVFLALSCLLPLVASAPAQSSDQALNDLRTQILNQRLLLQNFSADRVTNFDWTPAGLIGTPPKVRTVGVFNFTSAKLRKGGLQLLGTRSTVYKAKTEDLTIEGNAPIEINIAFKGADPAQVMPALKQQLFFPTLQVAIAAVPPEYRRMLFPTEETSKSPLMPSPQECPASGANYMHPTVLYSEAPHITDQARQARFSGSVIISLTIDENGLPSELWLRKPAGLGMDESAIKAVSDYKFKPATCAGAVVRAPMMIDVNFVIR
jgi:TonB family protein